jgi:hypothetical protein
MNSATRTRVHLRILPAIGLFTLATMNTSTGQDLRCPASLPATCQVYESLSCQGCEVGFPFDVPTAAQCLANATEGQSVTFDGGECLDYGHLFDCEGYDGAGCTGGVTGLDPVSTAQECADQGSLNGSVLFDGLCIPSTLLPVELSSFSAIAAGPDVRLSWTTASETNNAGFDIETRPAPHADQSYWRSIAFVEGSGTTSERQVYEYRAVGLGTGVHEFRLKQVDFDGAFEYSEVVEAAVEVPGEFVLEPAYPNPFNPTTTFRFGVASDQQVRAVLYDAAGQAIRALFEGTVRADEMRSVTVVADNLPSGSYVVRLTGERFNTSMQVVLVK